jgi:hypothetical protein
MRGSLRKVSDCIYVDEAGKTYFSVEDFIRMNKLLDCRELRLAIVEEVLEMWPEILILEHWH